MVALMMTSLRGLRGSLYCALSDRGILDHLADSAIDWALLRGRDLMGEWKRGVRADRIRESHARRGEEEI